MLHFFDEVTLEHAVLNETRLFGWEEEVLLGFPPLVLPLQVALPVVYDALLSLDVFEHVLVLGEGDVVGEDARVLLVKLEDLGQPASALRTIVLPLQKL